MRYPVVGSSRLGKLALTNKTAQIDKVKTLRTACVHDTFNSEAQFCLGCSTTTHARLSLLLLLRLLLASLHALLCAQGLLCSRCLVAVSTLL